jgi:carbon-monoxide dehydrogenase small subunit
MGVAEEVGAPGSDVRVTGSLNGCPFEEQVPAEELLLDFLRERMRLTGAKLSCGVQVCGACTVLVDGRPLSACCTLAAEVDERSVVTVEGLAEQEPYRHAVAAFLATAPLQCGFCTPGMVTTLAFLLSTGELTEHSSTETVAELFAGNLCRCTGYQGIAAAAREAARLAGLARDPQEGDPRG